MDKENKKTKAQTKIPLPKKPLPPVPHTLIKPEQERERHPLKTINWQNEQQASVSACGEKPDKMKNKTKSPSKVQSQYVTVRQNTDDKLDWEYRVFKDDLMNAVIVNEDDVVDECNDKDNYFRNNHEKNDLGDSKRAVTPALKVPILESNRVKNIKRSLKRPHSRELQGLSQARQDTGEERHKRRLNFTDDLQMNQSPDFWKRTFMTALNRNYIDDIFEHLLRTEQKTPVPMASSERRACAINWLIKLNGQNGNPATVHTARWYLDSVLAICNIRHSSVQIVAAACYWIGQKLHGPSISSQKMINFFKGAFSNKSFLAAESAILRKLKFPPLPVIPQDFISYLSWSCDIKNPGETEIAATFLCLSGILVDKSLCKEFPSAIGAAAVRNAIILLRSQSTLARLNANLVYKVAETKVSNISEICTIQRKAVSQLSSPLFKYKALLEIYSSFPYEIPQKLINSINERTAINKNVCNKNLRLDLVTHI